MSQQSYGLGGMFRSRSPLLGSTVLKPILGEIGKIGVTVEADLLKNMVAGVIGGKSVKEVARESEKQAGKQSINLAGETAVKALQSPPKPAATKRPRSQSAGEGKKRKKQKSLRKEGGRKRKRKAVGVVFPRAMTSRQRRSLPAKDIFG
jgi:hypothetical protein